LEKVVTDVLHYTKSILVHKTYTHCLVMITANRCRCKPSVGGVFLESKAEQSQLLVGDRVEQSVDNMICKASFLKLVHLYHLHSNKTPVTRVRTIV